MIQITIDDKQINDFLKKSPARANWALKEAFGKTGGHYRKWLQGFIQGGGQGWRPLGPASGGPEKSPLYALGALTRFKVAKIQKTFYRLSIGFFHARKTSGTRAATFRKFKARFKASFNMTPMALAKKQEYGYTKQVTDEKRAEMASRGYPLRADTKKLTTPARPMIGLFWKKKRKEIPRFVEKAFFDLFFSKKNQRLKI